MLAVQGAVLVHFYMYIPYSDCNSAKKQTDILVISSRKYVGDMLKKSEV